MDSILAGVGSATIRIIPIITITIIAMHGRTIMAGWTAIMPECTRDTTIITTITTTLSIMDTGNLFLPPIRGTVLAAATVPLAMEQGRMAVPVLPPPEL